MIANAQCPNTPIIYCNDAFCQLFMHQRPELVQKSCICEFLYGPMTSTASKSQISQALTRTEETQIIIWLYKKDGRISLVPDTISALLMLINWICLKGTNFLCKLLLAPVKNENLEVILFVLNFDELNESLDNKAKRFSKRNRLLQQIGMPFISSIFARTPSPNKETATAPQNNDPFAFLSKRKKSSFVRETLSRTNSKTSTFEMFNWMLWKEIF